MVDLRSDGGCFTRPAGREAPPRYTSHNASGTRAESSRLAIVALTNPCPGTGSNAEQRASESATSRVEARSRRHPCDPLCREVGTLHGVGRSHRVGVAAGARCLRVEPQLPRVLTEPAGLRDADSGLRDDGDPFPEDRLRDVGEVVEL